MYRCASFVAYDTSNSKKYQEKQFYINSGSCVKNYFTGKSDWSIPLEQNKQGDTRWKSFGYCFVVDNASGNIKLIIGHGDRRDENNSLLLQNTHPIKVTKLRIVKIPSDYNSWKIPKYYLETEENYLIRLTKAFSNISFDAESKLATITFPKYSESHPLYEYYKESKLSYVSFPFKYTISDKQAGYDQYIPKYTLSYTALGRPSFSGNIVSSDKIPENKTLVNPAINIEYNSKNFQKIFVSGDSEYPTYSPGADDELPIVEIIMNNNEADRGSYKSSHYLRAYTTPNKNSLVKNRINLPVYNLERSEEPYLIKKLIINPYGYLFDSLVDAEYVNGDPVYVKIPLYADGEIRLMMKNAEYTTDLPTFAIEVEYSNLYDLEDLQTKIEDLYSIINNMDTQGNI